MPRFQNGKYTPSNPAKYLGKRTPHYRSGWELAVFRMCDNHPAILGWGSETHRIPIKTHLLESQVIMFLTYYLYIKTEMENHAEFVEIKPASQTLGEAKTQAQKHKQWLIMLSGKQLMHLQELKAWGSEL